MNRRVLLLKLSSRQLAGEVSSRVLLAWAAGLFAAAQLKDTLDYNAINNWWTTRSVFFAGITSALLIAAWSVLWSRTTNGLLFGPHFRILWRQPIKPVDWCLVVAPTTLTLALPLVLPAGLLHGFWRLDTMILWPVLAVLPIVGFGGRSLTGLALGLAFAILGGTVAGLAHAWPGLTWILVAFVFLLVTATVGPLYRRLVTAPSATAWSLPGRPKTALSALVRRDLLCLWRTERGVIWAWLIPAAPVGFCLFAMAHFGRWNDTWLTGATLVLLAFVAPVSAWSLDRLCAQLRHRFDPPRWPIATATRTLGLVVVAGLALCPSFASAALTAHLPTISNLQLTMHTLALAAGAPLVVAHRQNATGSYFWWVLLSLVTMVLPSAAGPAFSLLLVVAAFSLASRALRRRRVTWAGRAP